MCDIPKNEWMIDWLVFFPERFRSGRSSSSSSIIRKYRHSGRTEHGSSRYYRAHGVSRDVGRSLQGETENFIDTTKFSYVKKRGGNVRTCVPDVKKSKTWTEFVRCIRLRLLLVVGFFIWFFRGVEKGSTYLCLTHDDTITSVVVPESFSLFLVPRAHKKSSKLFFFFVCLNFRVFPLFFVLYFYRGGAGELGGC